MINGTMMQYFHWYYPGDGTLWNKVKADAPRLASLGINAVWLPPATKGASGGHSVGYDVYDLYDLGEFDSKGLVRTRYGTRVEYLQAIEALHKNGIQVYADIVVNHLGGGDETETIKVIKMNPDNRNEGVSEPYDIEAYTKFTYPARNKKYSDYVWDHMSFSGVDYDHASGETAIYNIQNEHGADWEEMITSEMGNYDYLMYCDIEFRNPAVREELKRWGKWYYETTGIDGFRLDAVKHISPLFYNEWLAYMREISGKEMFAVGEYWAPGDLPLLLKYIEATEGRMSIFDAALHHNLHAASKGGNSYDLTKIFDNSLVQVRPDLAVTVVENHDTQPLQSLEAPVDPWFKPLAYALILLRDTGYPCIFYPDLYGADYTDKGRDDNEHQIIMPALDSLSKLCKLRKEAAYGTQHNYLDFANCIGWTREGVDEVEASGCAIVMSNGEAGSKHMYVGLRHAGKIFEDALGNIKEEIMIDEKGETLFTCAPGSLSVWVNKELLPKISG